MSPRRIWANPILFSAWLNETFKETVAWQQEVIDEYDRIVMAPLASAKNGVLPRQNSFDRLQAWRKAGGDRVSEGVPSPGCGRMAVIHPAPAGDNRGMGRELGHGGNAGHHQVRAVGSDYERRSGDGSRHRDCGDSNISGPNSGCCQNCAVIAPHGPSH